MEHLEMKEIESAVEAILFASGEPVQVERICVALEIDQPTVEQVLQRLMDYYAYERRGIRLLHIEDSWQLCSAPDYADLIRELSRSESLPSSVSPRWRSSPSSPNTSPPPGLMWTRSGVWTAPIPSDCCWTASSLKSADGCRSRAGRISTGPPSSSCGLST